LYLFFVDGDIRAGYSKNFAETLSKMEPGGSDESYLKSALG
jgi:hypothetical protein